MPKEMPMSLFVTGLMTCLIAMAFTMGATLTAESARMTKAEKVALKQAVVACKAEAKGKKIKWLARRKYVNQCVVAALKDHPGMDIQRMLKEHPERRSLPAEQWDAF
jgi:hypothetical protein